MLQLAPSPVHHSFEDLCLPLYNEMVNFARKLTHGDAQRAADIVQDSLLKAFQGWANFAPEVHAPGSDPAFIARGYLYRVVANTYVKDWHRKKIRSKAAQERAVDLLVATYGDRSVDEQQLTLGHRTQGGDNGAANSTTKSARGWCSGKTEPPVDSPFGDEVLAALAQLTPDHRRVIELYYIEQADCDEMAVRLGIPKNTIFTRLGRARRALMRVLGPYARAEYGFGLREPMEPADAVEAKADGVKRVVAKRNRQSLKSVQQSPDQPPAG